jgi:hypothetical protein
MQSGIRLPSRAGQAQSNLTLVPPPERIPKALEAAEDALKRFGELDMLKRVDEVNAMINRLNRQ